MTSKDSAIARKKQMMDSMSLEEATKMLRDVVPCGTSLRWECAARIVVHELIRLQAVNLMLRDQLQLSTQKEK